MLVVGIIGLEPIMTGPESVVLPITPYPNVISAPVNNPLFSFAMQRYEYFSNHQHLRQLFFKNS